MKPVSDDDDQILSEINVTPFVDVMLVLLIVFMISAPFMQQGMQVDLPQVKKSDVLDQEEADIVLTIDSKKTLFVSEYPVKWDKIEGHLQNLFAKRTNKKLFIRADASVPYGFVMKVMGKAKAAGIQKVGMVTETESLKRS